MRQYSNGSFSSEIIAPLPDENQPITLQMTASLKDWKRLKTYLGTKPYDEDMYAFYDVLSDTITRQ